MSRPAERLLHRALQANAVFSTLSGIAVVLARGWLAPELGLEIGWIVPALGAGLVGYGGFLWVLSRQQPIDRPAATGASVADGLWVTGSLVLVLWDPTGMTEMARWLVLGVADIVLVFGLAQGWGLYRSRRIPGTSGPS